MVADYSFYVKSIATYAPTFLRNNNSVLAIVATKNGSSKKRKQYVVVLQYESHTEYFHFALIKALIMSYVCNSLSSDLKFVIRHVK